jgi:type VI secretion system secreted protein Hcp
MAFDAFLVVRDAQAKQAAGLPIGESLDPLYKGAIEVQDFSFGVENTLAIGTTTTSPGAGKATFKEFTVTKVVDSASPAFFKYCAAGQLFPSVTLALRKSGSSAATAGKPYLIYSFGTVAVSSIEWSGASDDDLPTETITFAYGQMQISYVQQRPDGSVLPARLENWDRVASKAQTTPMPIPTE